MIGIVDYNAGNIKSVERALAHLKIDYILSKNPNDLENCDRLIFPGVGDAAYAMTQLKETGFGDFIKNWALVQKKPLLGICLGSQIIFDFSEEGDTNCLGLIPGKIVHFSNIYKSQNVENASSYKIPQIGWNNVTKKNGSSPIFDGVKENSDFYFVHSYIIQPENDEVIKGFANYGVEVPAVIQSKNIIACQFHPEKSGSAGLKLLENFCTKEILFDESSIKTESCQNGGAQC